MRSALQQGQRVGVDNVGMREILSLQQHQFGLPGDTVSYSDLQVDPTRHKAWTYEGCVCTDIRNGSTVWLKPVASRVEDNRPWWQMQVVGNTKAPKEEWNALQMVWGMDAFMLENDGAM